jgi:predicted outer membrane repeat protein
VQYMTSWGTRFRGDRYTGNKAGTGGALNLGPAASSAGPGSVPIRSCSFTSNQATSFGGAAMLLANTTITASTFRLNQARVVGGALMIPQGRTQAYSSTFEKNSVPTSIQILSGQTFYPSGGAVMTVKGGATTGQFEAYSCTFKGNSASSGGAIAMSLASASSQSSRFVNNTAARGGGAVSVNCSSCSFTSGSDTIRYNSAAYGGGIFLGDGSSASLTATAMGANTATVRGADVFGSGSASLACSAIVGSLDAKGVGCSGVTVTTAAPTAGMTLKPTAGSPTVAPTAFPTCNYVVTTSAALNAALAAWANQATGCVGTITLQPNKTTDHTYQVRGCVRGEAT